MLDNDSPISFLLTKTKNHSNEWIVETPSQRPKGPYFTPAVALQVATLEVLSARKRGLKANMFVRDSYDCLRLCRLMDKVDGLERCSACQGSWPATVGLVAPRCPLWEALRGRWN